MACPNPNIKNYGFGTRPKEEDDAIREKGLEARRLHPVTWTKDKCVSELNELLDILKKILREDEKLEVGNPKRLKQETIRDCVTLMNKILDFMKYLYPPTNTNLNINVDVQLEDIIQKWREKKKKLDITTEIVESG